MIIVEFLQVVVLGLFALKILWNLLLPYTLVWQLLNTNKERTDSVSVMPYLEVLLGFLAVVISMIIPGDAWNQNSGMLIMIVTGAIIGSIIHCIVIGFLGGLLASSLKKK